MNGVEGNPLHAITFIFIDLYMSGVKKRCVNEAIFSLNLYNLIGSKVITRLSLKEAAARVHMVICSLSSHGFNSTLHHNFFFLTLVGPTL